VRFVPQKARAIRRLKWAAAGVAAAAAAAAAGIAWL
jgi:hypothetical protein